MCRCRHTAQACRIHAIISQQAKRGHSAFPVFSGHLSIKPGKAECPLFAKFPLAFILLGGIVAAKNGGKIGHETSGNWFGKKTGHPARDVLDRGRRFGAVSAVRLNHRTGRWRSRHHQDFRFSRAGMGKDREAGNRRLFRGAPAGASGVAGIARYHGHDGCRRRKVALRIWRSGTPELPGLRAEERAGHSVRQICGKRHDSAQQDAARNRIDGCRRAAAGRNWRPRSST